MLELVFFNIFFALLINSRVHKKAEQHRGRAVYGHGYRGSRMAQIETRIQLLGIVQRGDAYSRISNLTINIRTNMRVFAVKGNRIERGGKPVRRLAKRYIMETFVGTLRAALASKHAGRVFALALKREHACR